MNYDIENDDSFTQPVGRWSVLYYGSGHMLNDITAACWFTYLLLFLTDIGLSPRGAAAVMLSGQIADGFATIFIGELVIWEEIICLFKIGCHLYLSIVSFASFVTSLSSLCFLFISFPFAFAFFSPCIKILVF